MKTGTGMELVRLETAGSPEMRHADSLNEGQVVGQEIAMTARRLGFRAHQHRKKLSLPQQFLNGSSKFLALHVIRVIAEPTFRQTLIGRSLETGRPQAAKHGEVPVADSAFQQAGSEIFPIEVGMASRSRVGAYVREALHTSLNQELGKLSPATTRMTDRQDH